MRCAVVPVARPTFDTAKAEQLTKQAFALLTEIGFETQGSQKLVMTRIMKESQNCKTM